MEDKRLKELEDRIGRLEKIAGHSVASEMLKSRKKQLENATGNEKTSVQYIITNLQNYIREAEPELERLINIHKPTN